MPNDEPNGVTIEELSTAVDLPVRTIRYYIAEGLIAGPGGRGKAALYGDDQLARLRLIRRLSTERLPLAEIKQRLTGLTTDDVTALLREEESRSTEIQLARGRLRRREYIAALLRNARAAREEPAPRAPSYSVHGAPVPHRAILESPPDFAPSEPARSTWEHWELAPGIVLHIRADARQPYRDLIDRLLREAGGWPTRKTHVTDPTLKPRQSVQNRRIEMSETHNPRNEAATLASVTLSPNPERKLIRPGGCYRHLDFRLVVSAPPRTSPSTRAPVRLGLVIDRSGSMSGGKLDTAKRAALGALDRLEPNRYRRRRRVRQRGRRDPAGRTGDPGAEGTGSRRIGADRAPGVDGAARGVARRRQGDRQQRIRPGQPERVAGVPAHRWPGQRWPGRSGSDREPGRRYSGDDRDRDEHLRHRSGLSRRAPRPMAVAGGGQFHHLRHAGEIASTFVGELGDLLAVAAARVRWSSICPLR